MNAAGTPQKKPPGAVKLSYLARFRSLFTGLLPLFMLAHFGHHVVGAMLNPLLPMIRDDFNLTYTSAGILVSVFSIVGGAAQLPAGWLADKIGTRRMIFLSISGVALGGLLIGLSNSYVMLVVLLAFTALLGGGYHPAAASAISNLTPPDKRGRALGLHLIGGTSSFWFVLLLVAPMAAVWSWRSPFIILSIPIIFLGIALYYLIGKREIKQTAKTNSTNDKTPVVAEVTSINWRVFLPFIILSVGTGMITQSIASYYSLYATDVLKVAPPIVVLLMAIGPFLGMFVAPLGGYLADRIGAIPVVAVSCLLAGPLLFVVSLVSTGWVFAFVLILIGIINMSRAPSAETYLVTAIPLQRRATILGIYFFAGAELAGVMTPVAGRLIDTYGFDPVLIGGAITQVILALACTAFLWNGDTFRRRKPAV